MNFQTVYVIYLGPIPSQTKFLSDKLFDSILNTYRGKGLIRKYTKRSRKFEIIEEITSKQSTGNMPIKSSGVDQHQYYCESMHLYLFSLVKSMLNILMEEAIPTQNTSWGFLMLWFHKQLNVVNRKQLKKKVLFLMKMIFRKRQKKYEDVNCSYL